MEASVECTHCRVVMTSWSAPGSPIRYYQCPFCQRTHSSLYGEVFRRRAGARVVDTPAPPAAGAGIPMATQEDVRWARVKASASRWFARLDAEQQRCATSAPRTVRVRSVANAPRYASVPRYANVPEVDPADVVEVTPPARSPAARRKS